MTEQEWLAATDATPMLEFLRDRASHRKFRLFSNACCQQIWNFITAPALRQAVEVSERFADNAATGAQLSTAYRRAGRAHTKLREADEAILRGYEAALEKGVQESPSWEQSAIAAS